MRVLPKKNIYKKAGIRFLGQMEPRLMCPEVKRREKSGEGKKKP